MYVMVPIHSSQRSDVLSTCFSYTKAEKQEETTGFYPQAQTEGINKNIKYFNRAGELPGYNCVNMESSVNMRGYSVLCVTEGEGEGEGTDTSIAFHSRLHCFYVLPVSQEKLLVPPLKNKRVV